MALSRHQNVSTFRRYAKIGDRCVVYIDNDRIAGEIIAASGDTLVVQTIEGSFTFTRNEIYPL